MSPFNVNAGTPEYAKLSFAKIEEECPRTYREPTGTASRRALPSRVSTWAVYSFEETR
jgi:hypothetical protein